jgi:hypothetical protein
MGEFEKPHPEEHASMRVEKPHPEERALARVSKDESHRKPL